MSFAKALRKELWFTDVSFCRFIQHLENNGFYRQGSVSFHIRRVRL